MINHLAFRTAWITSSIFNSVSISTILCLDFWVPDLTETCLFFTPGRILAIKLHSSLFASPSCGGAAMLIPMHSALMSVTWLVLEFGFAWTGITMLLPLLEMQLIDCILFNTWCIYDEIIVDLGSVRYNFAEFSLNFNTQNSMIAN